MKGEQAIQPAAVARCLESKFAGELDAAMRRLAKSYRPKELAATSFDCTRSFAQRFPTA